MKHMNKESMKQTVYEFIQCSDEMDLLDIIEACLDQIDERYKNPILSSSTKQLVDISLKHIRKQKPRSKRSHNKKELVLKLFEKYHSATRTKKEVFEQVANELNITVKAVEKAYYLK